jgi:hypothetical protein
MLLAIRSFREFSSPFADRFDMQAVDRLLADVVLYVHFAYVGVVLFGLLAVLVGYLLNWDWVRNRWFRGLHLAMILIVVLEAWCGIECPLTSWENALRERTGQATHERAFVAELVHDLMFYEAEPWVFTVGYTLFAAAVVGTLFLVPPRWRTISPRRQ